MPTADKFTALGAGNGFASCVQKLRVSDHDYWTTLSGVNKDNPATNDELIKESLDLAMNLFWNLNGVTGGHDGAPNITLDLDEGDFDAAYWVENHGVVPEVIRDENKKPQERVCYSEWGASTGFQVPGGGIPTSGVRMSGKVYRMYDGDTSSETNFVGYGGDSFEYVPLFGFDSFSLSHAVYRDNSESAEYVEFNGMHFVGYMYTGSSVVEDISITGGTTATATLTYPLTGGGSASEILATLSSPTFYTY